MFLVNSWLQGINMRIKIPIVQILDAVQLCNTADDVYENSVHVAIDCAFGFFVKMMEK
jgi:hypothetical protein